LRRFYVVELNDQHVVCRAAFEQPRLRAVREIRPAERGDRAFDQQSVLLHVFGLMTSASPMDRVRAKC
jgi:hypothetical protein